MIWAVLLRFQSSKLLAHVGSVSWPLSSACFSRQTEMRRTAFLWTNKPFLSNNQPGLHVRAGFVVFLPVPCSSVYPCDFSFPCPLDLLLSYSRPFICSDLEADDSWVSLNRESSSSREVSGSVSRNTAFAGAVPGLLSQARSMQSLLCACLIPFQPQAAWSWANMPQLFRQPFGCSQLGTAQWCLLVTSPPGWGQQC